MDSATDDQDWIVSARCESARSVFTLLSCLQHVSSGRESVQATQQVRRQSQHISSIQPVTVFCSPSSLTFHAMGKAKQAQASMDIQAGLFSQYSVVQSQDATQDWQAGGEFCVNLSTVLECLQVFGTQSLDKTKISLAYNIATSSLKVELLEESGILSTATVAGLADNDDEDWGDSLATAFRSSPMASRIIVKSARLQELINELDYVAGATVVTVSLDRGGLSIATVGHLGECMLTLPGKGIQVVSLEIGPGAKKPRSYPLHSLIGSMKGLDIADETCITINGEGTMAIQHQVIDRTTGDGNPNFVDFILCSLIDDEEHVGEQDVHVSHAYNSPLRDAPMRKDRNVDQVHSPQMRRTMETESEDEAEAPSPPAASLFSSIAEINSTQETSRFVRPRSSYSSQSPLQSRTTQGNESDRSRNLLESSDDDEDSVDQASPHSQPLDVTVSVTRDRDDQTGCSSPELVYGH